LSIYSAVSTSRRWRSINLKVRKPNETITALPSFLGGNNSSREIFTSPFLTTACQFVLHSAKTHPQTKKNQLNAPLPPTIFIAHRTAAQPRVPRVNHVYIRILDSQYKYLNLGDRKTVPGLLYSFIENIRGP
jgi:hypothetical protein